jgi:hypothetical protein
VVVLLALIWLLPSALSLTGEAAAALRVALIVPTVSALFAPAQAFAEAGKAVGLARGGGRSSTTGDGSSTPGIGPSAPESAAQEGSA